MCDDLGRMHRTTAHLRETDIHSFLDPITQRDPGWRLWLMLLEATRREIKEPAWMTAVPRLKPDRPAGAPLLAEATVLLAPRLARRWVRRLLTQAGQNPPRPEAQEVAANARGFDALAMLKAAIGQDEPRLVSLAKEAGIDRAVLGALAHLAALPLLQACTRALQHQLPAAWPYGYCPVCGSWPTLAELRGIERTYRLRCARCGGDWGMPLLHCPYCGQSDHRHLGALVPENGGETRKVAFCMTCKGYLKVLTTLQGSPGNALVRDDLETIDLDLAALERGYCRPKHPGYALNIDLALPPSRLRTFFGWRTGTKRSNKNYDDFTPC
jgi:FdhE protein